MMDYSFGMFGDCSFSRLGSCEHTHTQRCGWTLYSRDADGRQRAVITSRHTAIKWVLWSVDLPSSSSSIRAVLSFCLVESTHQSCREHGDQLKARKMALSIMLSVVGHLRMIGNRCGPTAGAVLGFSNKRSQDAVCILTVFITPAGYPQFSDTVP